ncbi:MAG: NAD(+) diphosphatase [Sphingomonadales bacterium]
MNVDAPPGFVGVTLDRADHLRFDVEKIAALAGADKARLMSLAGTDPLLGEDGRLAWRPVGGQPLTAADLIFLGLDGDRPLFAPIAPPADESTRPPVFILLGAMHPEDLGLWGMARSLIAWHARHRFCSNCGAATLPNRAGWARKCDACGAEHFPRVDPVVIMLAEYDGKVLVGRQSRFPPRSFSALAGYVEHGESIEEAVARELKEEAGITVSNVRYLVSQPWPLSGALMIACLADADSDAITVDPHELETAMWVDRAGVLAALAGDPDAPFVPPPHYAIANTLLRRWSAGAAVVEKAPEPELNPAS